MENYNYLLSNFKDLINIMLNIYIIDDPNLLNKLSY
jgi:hypothetical protein